MAYRTNTIQIQYDPITNSAHLDPKALNLRKKEFVEWVCDCDFEVEFADDTFVERKFEPEPDSRFSDSKPKIARQQVMKDSKRTDSSEDPDIDKYEYTVKVFPKDKPEIFADPVIIIDPGPPRTR